MLYRYPESAQARTIPLWHSVIVAAREWSCRPTEVLGEPYKWFVRWQSVQNQMGRAHKDASK